MQFTIATIVAFLAAAVIAAPADAGVSVNEARAVAAMPACATGCVTEVGKSTGCGSNIKCICKKSSCHAQLKSCVKSRCPANELPAARSAATQACSKYGISIKID